MATIQQKPAETNVHITVQQQPGGQQEIAPNLLEKLKSKFEEKMESKEGEDNSFKQILNSLTETKKYLPQQVNTFLDSMEGKTIDDLRFEAMHLANKAQEEARRKTNETVENVKQKAQDITDMAKTRTNDIKQRGVDMVNNVVQPPLQATQNTTKNLASKVNDTTTGLANRGYDYTKNTVIPWLLPYVQKTQTMVTPYVTPYAEKLTPYAKKAKEYLPPKAKTFVEENVEGKSPEELGKFALSSTRKNLLNAKNATEIPSLGQLIGEVKDATFSGKLFYNSLGLSEQAANMVFGDSEVPKDAGVIRRIYNLNNKVNKGMVDMTWKQLGMASQMAKDMANQRVNLAKQGIYSRADMLKQRATPLMTRIGQTPLVPSFVFRLLRSGDTSGDQGEGMAGPSAGLRMGMEDTKGKAPKESTSTSTSSKKSATTETSKPAGTATQQAPGKISVKVDVVGVDAAEADSTISAAATAASGNTSTKAGEEGAIGNTNAKGLGDMGEPGMGVTTTGAEQKTEVVHETESHKKKKHHNKA